MRAGCLLVLIYSLHPHLQLGAVLSRGGREGEEEGEGAPLLRSRELLCSY